jgi:hypothetical protein
MPARIKITQGSAAGGRGAARALPFASLNLAITAMVAPRSRRTVQESNQMPPFESRGRPISRNWLWLAVVLCGCRAAAPLPDLFPPSVAGVWRRTALATPSLSSTPDPVPRTAVNRLQTATYEGPGKLEARAYELDSPAVALDLVQRWRPSADTVFFYRDRFFVVVKWDQAERKSLEAFVRELEARLGKPKEQTT